MFGWLVIDDKKWKEDEGDGKKPNRLAGKLDEMDGGGGMGRKQ
jgi:hypothetical protein